MKNFTGITKDAKGCEFAYEAWTDRQWVFDGEKLVQDCSSDRYESMGIVANSLKELKRLVSEI